MVDRKASVRRAKSYFRVALYHAACHGMGFRDLLVVGRENRQRIEAITIAARVMELFQEGDVHHMGVDGHPTDVDAHIVRE